LHECVVGRPFLSSMYGHVPIYHRGVGIDFPLQSCCCLCYVIQPVDHLLHECVVGCPILSSSHVRTSVRPSTILIFRIWIRWIFFRPIVRRLRSFRLKRFEFYANLAKLKRRLRSFRLKRFEVYANFARLSTLMSVKFVVAKHSFQTLRGVR